MKSMSSLNLVIPIPSKKITPPIVLESKISLECKLNQIVQIGEDDAGSGFIVIGTIFYSILMIMFTITESSQINFKPLGRVAANGICSI